MRLDCGRSASRAFIAVHRLLHRSTRRLAGTGRAIGSGRWPKKEGVARVAREILIAHGSPMNRSEFFERLTMCVSKLGISLARKMRAMDADSTV